MTKYIALLKGINVGGHKKVPMADLREVKTKEELSLLKKAVFISAMGQVEIMKAMHPKMSETEVQGVHEFVYKKYGAEYEGYPSIVGAGNNGCILHYIENNRTKVGNDLDLIGADLHLANSKLDLLSALSTQYAANP